MTLDKFVTSSKKDAKLNENLIIEELIHTPMNTRKKNHRGKLNK